MKRKTYLATIINNNKVSRFYIYGYNKPSVKKEITDYYIKNEMIENYKKFDIYLKQVVNVDGEYIEVE